MERKLVRRLFSVFVTMSVFFSLVQTVFADEPYNGYFYDDFYYAVPSPNGYVPDRTVSSGDVGAGSFDNPQDLFVDENNNVYIVDSGNNRIVVTDSSFKLVNIIDKFTYKGKDEKLESPSGIFVPGNEKLYIADTGNSRILVSDMQGNISQVLTKPTDPIYPSDVTFDPRKLVVDRMGNIYAVIKGMYYGAVMYSPEGKFIGFYGANRVEQTINVISDYIWKIFLNRTQRQHMRRTVAVEFTNVSIDKEGFIYTCTEAPLQFMDRVKKLSPGGVNLYKDKDWSQVWFGDYHDDYDTSSQRYIGTRLIDICTDRNGFVNVLDYQRGRVFQYDSEGRRLLIFGGIGDQVGLSKVPAAIETLGDDILLLDSDSGRITVYRLTTFGKYIHSAIELFNQGLYKEALEPWKEVLKRDSNYVTAYIGIGEDLYNNGEFKKAMEYFKLGGDVKSYNKAFKGYRSEVLRDNFSWVFVFILMMAFLPFLIKLTKKVLKYLAKRKMKKAAGSPSVNNNGKVNG